MLSKLKITLFLLTAALSGLWAGCANVESAKPAGPVTAAEPARTAQPPTLFLVGDSTMHNSGKILGWGDVIGAQFDASRVRVVNCVPAGPGRSTRSYRNEGLWAAVLRQAKPGDYVFIQFGHIDSAKLEDPKKIGIATLPGTGPETAVTANTRDHKEETVHTYGWYLTQYITEAKAKGLTPVIFSPVPRDSWSASGKFKHVMAVYTDWAGQVTQAQGVPFVDLETLVSQRYIALGQDATKAFFPQDNTHTGPEGARLNADCVVEGLKGLPNFPLCADLKSAQL